MGKTHGKEALSGVMELVQLALKKTISKDDGGITD